MQAAPQIFRGAALQIKNSVRVDLLREGAQARQTMIAPLFLREQLQVQVSLHLVKGAAKRQLSQLPVHFGWARHLGIRNGGPFQSSSSCC